MRQQVSSGERFRRGNALPNLIVARQASLNVADRSRRYQVHMGKFRCGEN